MINSIKILEHPFSLSHPFLKLPDIYRTISLHLHAAPVLLILIKIASIYTPICFPQFSFSLHYSISKSALIDVSIRIEKLALAVGHIMFPVSLVFRAIVEKADAEAVSGLYLGRFTVKVDRNLLQLASVERFVGVGAHVFILQVLFGGEVFADFCVGGGYSV